MSLCVRMKQHGSHLTNFHEIKYLSIITKYLEKIQVSFKPDENGRYFALRPIHVLYYISLSSS
jgi:CO dehydrogenase/acetyl-CoA synthase epsilon subunit